jgi:hypothetical protein
MMTRDTACTTPSEQQMLRGQRRAAKESMMACSLVVTHVVTHVVTQHANSSAISRFSPHAGHAAWA